MPKAARILIAGILAASAAPSAAISQSTVLNNQITLGDVFSGQTLNVVDVSDSTTLTNVASGNEFIGSVVGTVATITSTQAVSGNVGSSGIVNATGSSGEVTAISVSATGNTGESNAINASIIGNTTQSVGAGNVTALAEYVGPTGRTGALQTSAQAIANSQGYGASAADIEATITQSSAATTQADAGGTLQYTDGVAVFSALATSNNVTAVGTSGANQLLNITQTMTGQRTQASVYANAGNAQDILGQATVTGNNVNATGVDALQHELTVNQTNTGYLRSEAVISSYDFGAGTANAYGVGNSVMAGNYGPDITLNNTQANSGAGIEVIASFTGNGGYDAYSTATAVGNAVTGYACSDCQGRMTITNRQTSSADISATSGVNITGSNRAVTGVATANGNTATFYVSQPH